LQERKEQEEAQRTKRTCQEETHVESAAQTNPSRKQNKGNKQPERTAAENISEFDGSTPKGNKPSIAQPKQNKRKREPKSLQHVDIRKGDAE